MKYDIEELQSISGEEKKALIRDIYYDTNTSIRQLSRVTGRGCGQNPGDKFTSGGCPCIQARRRQVKRPRDFARDFAL